MTPSEHTPRTLRKSRRDRLRLPISSNGARPQLRLGRAAEEHLARRQGGLALAFCLLLVLLCAQGSLAVPSAKRHGSTKMVAETAPTTAARRAAKRAALLERLSTQYQLEANVEEVDGRMMKARLLRLLSRHDVRHFLAVIREAEGGEANIMVGGCHASSLQRHPALTLPRSCWFCFRMGGRRVCSSASGNYQINWSNWSELAPFLGVTRFTETDQALVALELIRRGGGAAGATTPSGLALKRRIQRGFLHLLVGEVNSALCLSSQDWASSSCSTLPAATKVDYVELSGEIKKREAAREQGATRSDKSASSPPGARGGPGRHSTSR